MRGSVRKVGRHYDKAEVRCTIRLSSREESLMKKGSIR